MHTLRNIYPEHQWAWIIIPWVLLPKVQLCQWIRDAVYIRVRLCCGIVRRCEMGGKSATSMSFKWFIDAHQQGTKVWLITTDTLSPHWEDGFEKVVMEPLNKINQPALWACCSDDHCKSEKLWDDKCWVYEKRGGSSAILRLSPVEGQQFKVEMVYCVAMDSTGSKKYWLHPSTHSTFTVHCQT